MAVPQAESIYSFSTPEGKVLAGVTAVRARGRKGGRLKTHKAGAGLTLYNDKTNTIDDICRKLDVSRATLYRYINKTAISG